MKDIIFIQHSVKVSGSSWSLSKIISGLKNTSLSHDVLVLRKGATNSLYGELGYHPLNGSMLLPFHGSEVSGMSVGIAIRNIASLPMSFITAIFFLRQYRIVYLNSSCLVFYGYFTKLFNPKCRILMHLREPLSDNVWGKIIKRISNKCVDEFIAISQNEMKNIGEVSAPISIVYNYADESIFLPIKNKSIHRKELPGKRAYIGYFARVNEKNGIYDFLKVAEMFAEDKSMVFCVYGCTEYQIENLSEEFKLLTNVIFLPMVTNIPENLGDLDVLLVPFNVPHFSRSVIEAALMEIPSIVYDVDSLNELVEHELTGYIVPPGDIDSMARILKSITDAPVELKAMGKRCREIALERFSSKNFTVIQDIISSNATH